MKNLGVYLDRYLLFDVHINELKRKVMGILYYKGECVSVCVCLCVCRLPMQAQTTEPINLKILMRNLLDPRSALHPVPFTPKPTQPQPQPQPMQK